MAWKRKERVTGLADPTSVVEWKNDEFEIVEFQNVYVIEVAGPPGKPWIDIAQDLARELHQALEREHEANLDENETVKAINAVEMKYEDEIAKLRKFLEDQGLLEEYDAGTA